MLRLVRTRLTRFTTLVPSHAILKWLVSSLRRSKRLFLQFSTKFFCDRVTSRVNEWNFSFEHATKSCSSVLMGISLFPTEFLFTLKRYHVEIWAAWRHHHHHSSEVVNNVNDWILEGKIRQMFPPLNEGHQEHLMAVSLCSRFSRICLHVKTSTLRLDAAPHNLSEVSGLKRTKTNTVEGSSE